MLRFILGRPGTGKTHACLAGMSKQQEGLLYYLVPEQFSLQSERLILSGVGAVTRLQVLSFNRLCYRLFSFLGGPQGEIVDELGQRMLLRKVLFEVCGDLKFYANALNMPGFVEDLARSITELNRYRITPDDLRLRASEGSIASQTQLSAKLWI